MGIQRGYSQDTGRIQSGYSGDTVRYSGDTVRIQWGHREDTVRIQGGYSQDTVVVEVVVGGDNDLNSVRRPNNINKLKSVRRLKA